LVFLDTSY